MKILGVLGAVIALVLALGTVTYYVNLSANTYRAMNGDSSAVGAIVNDTTTVDGKVVLGFDVLFML